MYANKVKRIIDFTLSFIALIVLFPVILIIFITVRINIGTPAIFKQKRIGKDNKEFILYKFRTMTNETDSEGNLLPDDERTTKLGNFLRKSSLDELPELINIIKGEMSIVGPRPLLVRYLDYYTEEEKHRHDVLPGLTGYAQVNGRNFLTWEEKFELDLKYIEECSFVCDLKVILSTIKQVLSKGDVLELGEVYSDEKGLLWVNVNGEKKHVCRALDVERREKIEEIL